ncbi:hypothetical protein COU58_01600 [Candidatus Pacearchaeota archaeon CG10_big_fil_rev_8_21_14_0_10_32_42]|nr:MAG: hypothetical protein COU58_01600 [Candidatus Pacearchaeota archaeon CG10_big_fil_rev_8_21_14_0_10_32_42]
MNRGLKIVLGVLLFITPLYLIIPGMPLSDWGEAAWELIQGALTLFVLILGIILIIFGINELKN